MRKYPIVEIEDMAEPFCGVRRKNMVTLSDAHPYIAEEWVYAKNAGWGPEDVSRASGVRCWWLCRFCNRDYKAQICNRTSGQQSACPYCASKRVCDENSFMVWFPEVAKEWHPTKNGKLKAEEFTHASGIKVWWLCSTCSHDWKCAIADRTCLESGCPACYEARMTYAHDHPSQYETPQRILDENSEPSHWYGKPSSESFVSLFEWSKALARQWHPTKNGHISANQISKGSDAIAWWKCPKGTDHEWQAPVYSRTKTKKAHCPFCLLKRLSVTNSLAALAPELAKEWHPTKNGKLRPDQVIAGGNDKHWYLCKRDKTHEWETKTNARMKGTQCPDCSHARVSKDNCLNKDFPYIAAQLHPTKNGEYNGDNIAAQSGTKRWWKCYEGPDHDWQATPANRTGRGSGCPACVGKQISVTNCLATLAPEKAKQWDYEKNGSLTPSMVSPHSKEVVWWLCEDGHSWDQSINKRVRSPITCWDCTGKTKPGTQAKGPAKLLNKLKTAAEAAKAPASVPQRQAHGNAK
ncbi:MAG: zinc-ribbon domain-containing protein [Candidatus Obscuribacterales bacterium]|nr:zinc-ribbon domain-containing protein [Candidatus Obscuribacterales bacterium]